MLRKIRADRSDIRDAALLRRARLIPAILAAVCLVSAASAQTVAEQVGLTALIQRVGPGNQPTGAGIGVGQAEAQESAGNAYPNTSHPEFSGKSFTAMSGGFGPSGHATLVGQNCYGSNAIAPGITSIFMYEAGSWLQGAYLRWGFGPASPPLTPPPSVRVFNNSWIADIGGSANNEALRRADFAIDRDDILHFNGLNNGGSQPPLMGFGFNGVAVGLTNGSHWSGMTSAAADGPGRQKPEIVAPGSFTSFSTPIVAAGAALMYETAFDIALAGTVNASRSEVIKASLLGGALHANLGPSGTTPWSNNPIASGASRGITTTPLDPVFGSGMLNVDRSHRILTGSEQNGSASVPGAPNASAAGWDFASLSANGVLNYRFRVTQTIDELSVLTTWHRTVASNFASYTLANFDLTLKRIDASGAAVTLVGNAGLPYFSSGNVVSQSTVNNLEHLYVRNLAPGDYVIELRRLNDGVAGPREVALAWIMPVTAVPGDVNGDGNVNVVDLLAVIANWGTCGNPNNCPADVTGDGVVNVADLLLIIANWG